MHLVEVESMLDDFFLNHPGPPSELLEELEILRDNIDARIEQSQPEGGDEVE